MMAIKNIDNLKRFDFTSNCRNCKFKKDLGFLEYCCSFVYDMIQEQRLSEVKKNILDYVFLDNQLDNVNPVNVFFNEDDEWSVTLHFKTNLIKEERIILSELSKVLNKSPYFDKVYLNNLQEDTRLKTNSTLDEYIKDMVI